MHEYLKSLLVLHPFKATMVVPCVVHCVSYACFVDVYSIVRRIAVQVLVLLDERMTTQRMYS